MNRTRTLPVARASGLLALALLASAAALASPVSAVNTARTAVCAPGIRSQLKETSALDGVAGRLRRGDSLHNALGMLPARPAFATTMHLAGLTDDHSIATAVAGRFCHDLADPRLSEIGVAGSGRELWIVVVAPLDVPAPGEQPAVAREVLARVNAARAAGHRCGSRAYPPVAPVRLIFSLSNVALEHSTDMARASSLEHRGRDGSLPADRVRRSGYAAQLVGENIAGGVPNAAEVVTGWLDSPAHCANIMDARFSEMGLAYAIEPRSQLQIYWTQLFAAPRGRLVAEALR